MTNLIRESKKVVLAPRALNDYEMLACGGFAPLVSFMGEADYRSCLATMRLATGELFPIPVVLPIDELVRPGAVVSLIHPRGDILATLSVRECFAIDPRAEAEALLGRFDEIHPYVAELLRGPKYRIAGDLTSISRPPQTDFVELRLSPDEVKARLVALGRANVVAFQTRNPLHRSHEELIKRAAREHDATILLHPVVGLTKPGDIDHFTRVRSYRALVARYFEPRSIVLSLLPLAMRMAGPREALWHALIRRNYGATHFIVGRDHAGPGPDSNGRPFFEPYAAQQLVAWHAAELGLTVVPFHEMVYVEDEDRFEEADRVKPGARVRSLSGTQVRQLLMSGAPLPEWFTRPETAAILQQAHPPRRAQGFCVWFTGLSGSGKSSTADALSAHLMEQGKTITLLDGDEVRLHLSKGLGFSREDRDANVLRIAYVASQVVRHHGIAICAAISPYRGTRDQCRQMIGENFIEVFVDTDIAVCESRDSKGLYAKARAGELKGFTGVDDPYEPPAAAEVTLADPIRTPADNARVIMNLLRDRGLLPPA